MALHRRRSSMDSGGPAPGERAVLSLGASKDVRAALAARASTDSDTDAGSEHGYRRVARHARATAPPTTVTRGNVRSGQSRAGLAAAGDVDAPSAGTGGFFGLFKTARPSIRGPPPVVAHEQEEYNTSDDDDRLARRVAAAAGPTTLTGSSQRLRAISSQHAERAELYSPGRRTTGSTAALPPRHPRTSEMAAARSPGVGPVKPAASSRLSDGTALTQRSNGETRAEIRAARPVTLRPRITDDTMLSRQSVSDEDVGTPNRGPARMSRRGSSSSPRHRRADTGSRVSANADSAMASPVRLVARSSQLQARTPPSSSNTVGGSARGSLSPPFTESRRPSSQITGVSSPSRLDDSSSAMPIRADDEQGRGSIVGRRPTQSPEPHRRNSDASNGRASIVRHRERTTSPGAATSPTEYRRAAGTDAYSLGTRSPRGNDLAAKAAAHPRSPASTLSARGPNQHQRSGSLAPSTPMHARASRADNDGASAEYGSGDDFDNDTRRALDAPGDRDGDGDASDSGSDGDDNANSLRPPRRVRVMSPPRDSNATGSRRTGRSSAVESPGPAPKGKRAAASGANANKAKEPRDASHAEELADSRNEKAEQTPRTDDGHSKKSDADSAAEDDELEEFKFVRKTLPKSAFSHEELRAEFRCLDYSPLVNVRPVDLSEQLRPMKASRKLRMFICITCYNEDGDELRRTLHGIASNLPKLAKSGLHWSEVAVCIVIDGREAASQSMLDFLQYEMKLYDPSVLRTVHHGRPVMMHLFERSVELSKHSTQREYHHPLQCMLALKERNGGKLNSHLWFFSGFCVQVNPKYCVLVDVGTVPDRKALVKLWHAMEDDPQVGGVCGEITIRSSRPWHFLDAAQTFEYKVSHVMDKACESVFGYISVLPGAFSAYRWVAIRGEPLCAYFTIEEISAKDLGPFLANMYLAEDRILCFEILARRHRQWLLRYVSGAVAETDAPQSLIELIKQRRRWLNGSLFALLYYLYHFPRFMHTSHGIFRKLLFFIQFFFFLTTTVLAWFTIGTLFLSYMLIFNQTISYAPFGANELRLLFVFGYCALLFLQVMAGMAGKINTLGTIYFGIAMTYGILMTFSLMLGVWLVLTNGVTPFVGIGFACSLFSYLFAAGMHGTLFRAALMFVQYLVLLPVSVNVFPIYSFTNLHDISWGTKEGNLQAEQRRAHQGRAERAIKKAQKAREAIDRLRLEQTRAQRQAHTAALQAQRQALLAAAGIASPDGAAASEAAAKASAAAQAGITLKGGAGMMKVIDEDNEMAGYVDVSAMKGKDLLLDMSVNQAANLQARLGLLDPDRLTRKLIRDATRAAKLHGEAAAREKRLADELALDKARMQQDFNFFRMRMLSAWVLCNALLVVLVNSYDTAPPLGGYATYTTITVVYMIGVKLLGSMIYQLLRAWRWMFRRMCGFCYRIDESETGVTRVVCCCRPVDYYVLDDMWEDEHGYDHKYPDDVDAGDATMSPEEQDLVATANGLTLGGCAPDGTNLYYAADGSGPLNCNGEAIDPLAVGFLLGPNGELLLPDGSPANVGVVWVDDAGNPVELLVDASGQPVLDQHGNPIPVQALQDGTFTGIAGVDSGIGGVPAMKTKGSDGSLSIGTVRTVDSDVTHAVRAGELPDAASDYDSGTDPGEAAEAQRIRSALAKLQRGVAATRGAGPGGLMAVARAALEARREEERQRAAAAMEAARVTAANNSATDTDDTDASEVRSHTSMRSSFAMQDHEDDQDSRRSRENGTSHSHQLSWPERGATADRSGSFDSELSESDVRVNVATIGAGDDVAHSGSDGSATVSEDDDDGIAMEHRAIPVRSAPAQVVISSTAPLRRTQLRSDGAPGAAGAIEDGRGADTVLSETGTGVTGPSGTGVRTDVTASTSVTKPSASAHLRLVAKSSIRSLPRASTTVALGSNAGDAAAAHAPPPSPAAAPISRSGSRWSKMLGKLPEVLGLADASHDSSDSDEDDHVAPGWRRGGGSGMRRTPSDAHVRRPSSPGSDARSATTPSPATTTRPSVRHGIPSLALNEFPIIRVNSGVGRSARRGEGGDGTARGSARNVLGDSDTLALDVRAPAAARNAPTGAELFGYSDPVTGRWVPPPRQGEQVDEYDEDEQGSSQLPESPPESQLHMDEPDGGRVAVLRSRTPSPDTVGAAELGSTDASHDDAMARARRHGHAAAGGATGAAAARSRFQALQRHQVHNGGRTSLAAPAQREDVISLDDLLRDAEDQSDRIMRRPSLSGAAPGPRAPLGGARTGRGTGSRAPTGAAARADTAHEGGSGSKPQAAHGTRGAKL